MSEGKRNTRDVFLKNIGPWSGIIESVVGDSKSVSLPFQGECDAVFIDGDHSYEGCRSDADRFGKLVRNGGRLIMHDQAYYAGVTKVVGELLVSGEWYVVGAT